MYDSCSNSEWTECTYIKHFSLYSYVHFYSLQHYSDIVYFQFRPLCTIELLKRVICSTLPGPNALLEPCINMSGDVHPYMDVQQSNFIFCQL